MYATMRMLLLVNALALSAVSAVKVELHFESLCKQCQIHIGAFMDDVVHGG